LVARLGQISDRKIRVVAIAGTVSAMRESEPKKTNGPMRPTLLRDTIPIRLVDVRTDARRLIA